MSSSNLGSALHRPAVSGDGRFIAILTTNHELQIIQVTSSSDSSVLYQGRLPKVSSTFVAQLVVARWAQSSKSGEGVIPWLLLSDGDRLLVINSGRLLELAQNLGFTSSSFIAADYQLGDQFGKLTYADFVFDAEHVIVLLEASDTAMILSITRPHREEIPYVKTSASRVIARSSEHDTIAILRRVKGQDQLVLLGSEHDAVTTQACFNLPTFDAQGTLFCPGRDPIMAVWDSAAYGMKVHFFSAMGHILKTLAINSFEQTSGLDGAGLSQLRWSRCPEGTALAVADSNKQILVRYYKERTLSPEDLGMLKHPQAIDGTKSIVWQQVPEAGFSLQKGVFEAVQEPAAGGNTSLLELNCDASFLASTVADNARTVWIWQPEHSEPHTIITFVDPVRSLLWHPSHSEVLIIMTSTKQHSLFCWHTETRPPSSFEVSLPSSGSTKYEASWLKGAIDGRHPFMLSNTRSINYGFIKKSEGSIVFNSVLKDNELHLVDDEDSLEQMTPSKPARKIHTLRDEDEW